MYLAARTYTHLFLGILLLPLMEMDGAEGPCPTTCRCTMEILNCSRITNPPGFHQVPLPDPAVRPHPFVYLDFTGNAISSAGKEVWKAYPWAEHLILKDNSLSKLQNTYLEGLFSLTHLDLSCNKIQIIGRNTFEAAPFLQVINLSGNIIQQIAYGTFRAWHGMQFLLKVDLSHNPLTVIQDSFFYGLPSLRFLDLGATDITSKILEDLLQTSLQLRILILPQIMSCCLCRIKQDIKVFSETVKVGCRKSCAINATLCDTEEPLNRMPEEVMKVLKIRKRNGKNLLNILPERTALCKDLTLRTKPNKDRLALIKNNSSTAANFNLLEPVKLLMQAKADKLLEVNWADKGELKKLYLLTNLLQEALKERMVQLDEDSLEAAVQKALSAEASKVSMDNTEKGSTDASFKKESHVRKITNKNWLGTDQRLKDTPMGLGGDGREVAEMVTQSIDKPNVVELHNKAGSQRKPAEGLDLQHALHFLRSQQAALQSSWKPSISETLTNTPEQTGYTEEDNTGKNLASLISDGNHLVVLGNGFGAQVLTKGELLRQLLHRGNPPAEDSSSKISIEPSLKVLSSAISLPTRPYWEHQRSFVSPLMNLALQDDYLLQVGLFENELNKQLTSLIPNTPLRNLISHIICILEMDCMVPTIQMACTKLISRTGLLMKLFSENVNKPSILGESYLWPSQKVANTNPEKSRKLETPLDRTTGQEILTNEKSLLWAVSVTAVIIVIIALICLTEICVQRFAAKDRPFLDKRNKTLSDLESVRTDSQLMKKQLQLQDMYEAQDETQRKNSVGKLQSGESSKKLKIASRDSIKLPSAGEPQKKSSSKTLSIPVPTTAPPPQAPPTARKGSARGRGSSETTNSKSTSLTGQEKLELDEEDFSEKSETPSMEATTESGEEEDED